jgi:CubicO group peptidase (beta-lactamase class C family)
LTQSQQLFDDIDQCTEQLMHDAKIPGLVIAVTDRQQTLGISTYGLADIAAQIPISPETLFEIGSLGKPFTSIALLQLRDQGVLDLHAPVAQYLPWFEVQSEYPPITAHHLMNHTAGIVRGTDVSPHGLYEVWALRKTKARAAPGDSFLYSNVGYKVLGILLETLTGQSFQEVIRSRVLEPLGMRHSYPAMTHETRKKTAIGYCGLYDDRPEHPTHERVPAIWSEYGTGDGCQVSTAGDMTIYLRMLLNRGKGVHGPILSQASFDLMSLRGKRIEKEAYGYGLGLYSVGGRTLIRHGGGNAGYRSAIALDPEAGLGVVFLMNLAGNTYPIVEAAIRLLTRLLAAPRQQALAPVLPALERSDMDNAADYAGVYRAGDRFLRLTAESGKLLLSLLSPHGDQVIALERFAEDQFYVRHPDYDLFLLEFGRQQGKVVEAFHGPDWYVNDHYTGPLQFTYPEAWMAYTGHYRAHNPDASNFRVVLRKGALVALFPTGEAESLTSLDDGWFRIDSDELSTHTLHFDAVASGPALLAEYAGCPYYRAFTP